MKYIVVDLEWNQALSSKSPVFNRLPLHLRGEIIEIGAVMLNDDFTLGDEFSIDIKPVYFKKMHYKVKKITGFDADRLSRGASFSEAYERFHAWCGDDVTFITWGCDDQAILEQNIIIHDLFWEWIKGWVNLQVIYNIQTASGKTQKSLATAMEHFGIEQTRTAHDALGDAYNTALVSTFLDLKEGLRTYQDADRILSAMEAEYAAGSSAAEDPNAELRDFSQMSYSNYESKAAAFNDPEVSGVKCPVCGIDMTGKKWLNQGDQRYINIFTCETDGSFFVRLRFKKHSEELLWDVRKLIYPAEKAHEDMYRDKLKQVRRRGRSHSKHKKQNK